MAVGTTNAMSGPFSTNGATTDFPFTFTALSAYDVKVISRDADGVDTVVSPGSYSVTLGSGSGGTVSFDTAPATGATLYILLDPTLHQDTEFEEGGRYLARAHNAALDRAALRDQALRRDVDRSLRVAVGGTAPAVGSVSNGQVLALVDDQIRGIDNDVASDGSAALSASAAAASKVAAQTARDQARASHISSATSANLADAHADRAEIAAAAAMSDGKIYASTAAGIADTSNGDYFFVLDVGGAFAELYKNVSAVATDTGFGLASPATYPALSFGGSLNLFDATSLTDNFEVYNDGSIQAQADSVLSDFMFVRGETSITISGLPANPGSLRYGVFLAADRTTVLDVIEVAVGTNSGTFAVPDGAWFFRLTVRQRYAGADDFGAVQVEGGTAPSAYQPFLKRLAAVNDALVERTQLTFVGDRNLFDGGTIAGYEVYSDGTLQAQADSVITNPIDIAGASFVTISGMPANPDFPLRYYRFLDAYGTVVGTGDWSGSTTGTFAVPGNSATFQISLQQRQSGTSDLSAVQIEVGATPTVYQPFSPRVIEVNGFRVKQPEAGEVAANRWVGRSYVLFGDSITETNDVDAGSYLYPDGTRANWPDYAFPVLDPLSVYNYAKAGSHFIDWAGDDGLFQKISKQIDQAIADARTPNVVVVAMGTNDINTGSIGTYATAMGKAVGSLDLTLSMEAARKAFYRIQNQWPNAKKFYCTPLQRASITPDNMQANVDEFARMAARYGFEVIDCFRQANIVADFETVGVAGDDLVDGLHPHASGQQKQGELIAARIMARLSA